CCTQVLQTVPGETTQSASSRQPGTQTPPPPPSEKIVSPLQTVPARQPLGLAPTVQPSRHAQGPSVRVRPVLPPSHAIHPQASNGGPACCGFENRVPPSARAVQPGSSAASAATFSEPQPLAESYPGPADGPVTVLYETLPLTTSWKAKMPASVPPSACARPRS